MIERLDNCPNCGGILDEFGSCQFCGSKVYDMCNIDVSNNTRGINYLRIKTDNQIILAPVITNTVNITVKPDEWPTMDVEFVVTGNVIMKRIEDMNHD